MEVVTEEDPPEVIETLEKGDYFGEMFLIHACPQKMSLRAATHVDMLLLSKEDLDALLVHDLHVAKQVSEVAERLYPNPSKTKWCAYLSATINPHSFIIFHHYNDIRKKNSFKTVFDSGFKAKYIHFWVFFTLISWSLVSRILFSCMKSMNKSCFLYSLNRYTVFAICWNHNNYFFNSILLQIHKRLRCGHFEKQWFRVIITYVSVIISTKSLHLARKYVQIYFCPFFSIDFFIIFNVIRQDFPSTDETSLYTI